MKANTHEMVLSDCMNSSWGLFITFERVIKPLRVKMAFEYFGEGSSGMNL